MNTLVNEQSKKLKELKPNSTDTTAKDEEAYWQLKADQLENGDMDDDNELEQEALIINE